MKILLNLLWTPLKFLSPFFILFIGRPTIKANAAAATEFLILWVPNKGILNFLINWFFLLGNFILKSNSENSFSCLIFFIQKLVFYKIK